MMLYQQLSGQLRADVQRYIDAHYMPGERLLSFAKAAPQAAPPAEASKRKPKLPRLRRRRDDFDAALFAEEAMPAPGSAAAADEAAAPSDRSDLRLTLELDEPFSVKLLKLIDQKEMDDIVCYKKAQVSRQTWYKILNEKDYKPNKKAVLSFAVALELTLEETQTLLASVGFVLSQSSLFDVIMMYCLSHEIYSAETIDALLFQYDQETLYSKA